MLSWGRNFDSIYYIAAFGNSCVAVTMTFFWKAFQIEGLQLDTKEEVAEEEERFSEAEKAAMCDLSVVDKYIGTIVAIISALILLAL